jgi:CheY-like chemotaxis protein
MTENTMQSPHLLIVDDEPFNLQIIAEYLEPSDYELVLANSGSEALARLEASGAAPFDLIVLDRMMPGLDGMEVLKRVKEDPRLAAIPVIMQTAAAAPEQVREGLAAGAYYYLTKPFEPDALVTIVRSALNDRLERSALEREVSQQAGTVNLLRKAEFRLRTLEEARMLAGFASRCAPSPGGVVMGLSELLINAIEHGNLGITYAEKTALKQENRWHEEIARRLRMPQYESRYATLNIERADTEVTYIVTDQGQGFDWKPYLDFDPFRAFDPNGRGIAMARQLAFSSLRFADGGRVAVATVSLHGIDIGS